MRFLMVSSFYPPHHFGGDATYVRQLVEALKARGHEVDVVYCHDAYRISGGKMQRRSQVDADGSVIQLHSRFGGLSPLISQLTGRPGLKHGALERLFERDYDVVHFHNISLIGGPRVVAMSKAAVTLFTAHEHWTVCPTHILWKNGTKACDKPTCFSCQIRSGRPPQLWRHTSLMADALGHVDMLLAPSEFTAAKLRQGGVDCPMTVLPHFAPGGFDTLVAGETAPARPGFLFVGRVTRSKGIEDLLRLFAKRPDYDLHVVGDGDLLEALKQRYGDDENIIFEGHMPQAELVRHYRRARAVILPSLAPETFGLVSVEAFAQATPAIVRDAGGAGETVRQSGAGVVYDDETSALAAIDLLARDDTVQAQMSQRARQAYLEHYTEDIHLNAYLGQIEQLMAGGAQT